MSFNISKLSSHRVKYFLNTMKADKNIHLKTCMLLINNEKIVEHEEYPYSLEDNHILFSMTKSITGIAIGIAQDLGLLSLEDCVVDYFKEVLDVVPSENLLKMRIKDLLTMTCGQVENTYFDIMKKKDWVKTFINQEFPETPGTYFRYNTHGSHMLSAIIKKVSGVSLAEFTQKHLFDPLGIEKPDWERCPMGNTAGGMGLSLKTGDIAKVGLLLLNEGVYEGKQVVSKDYVRKATTEQIDKRTAPDYVHKTYSGYGYGYQIHIGKDGYYRMDGAFGQFCLVVPKMNMVFVCTALGVDKEALFEKIYTYLIEGQLNEVSETTCKKEIENEFKRPLSKWKDTAMIYSSATKVYLVEDSSCDYKKLSLLTLPKLNLLSLESEFIPIRVQFTFDKPFWGKGPFIKDLEVHQQKYRSIGTWIRPDLLEIEVVYLETPYVMKFTLEFKDEALVLDFQINHSFVLKSFKSVCKEIL
jgi:hypothetical protein